MMMMRRARACGGGVLVLTWAAALLCVANGAVFTLSGREKDAWPELLHAQVSDAVSALTASGMVKNIYVQPPGSGAPPLNPGDATDVWLYTDGSAVYEIPRRGVWHPNRLSLGWPEVTGMDYLAAISKLELDMLGVTIIYGPKGFLRTGDVKLDRVWLDVNSDGTVYGVPSIG